MKKAFIAWAGAKQCNFTHATRWLVVVSLGGDGQAGSLQYNKEMFKPRNALKHTHTCKKEIDCVFSDFLSCLFCAQVLLHLLSERFLCVWWKIRSRQNWMPRKSKWAVMHLFSDTRHDIVYISDILMNATKYILEGNYQNATFSCWNTGSKMRDKVKLFGSNSINSEKSLQQQT